MRGCRRDSDLIASSPQVIPPRPKPFRLRTCAPPHPTFHLPASPHPSRPIGALWLLTVTARSLRRCSDARAAHLRTEVCRRAKRSTQGTPARAPSRLSTTPLAPCAWPAPVAIQIPTSAPQQLLDPAGVGFLPRARALPVDSTTARGGYIPTQFGSLGRPALPPRSSNNPPT